MKMRTWICMTLKDRKRELAGYKTKANTPFKLNQWYQFYFQKV